MEYGKLKDTLIVRIDKGEEILQQLRRVSEQEGIRLAEVSALGAINDFMVGAFDTEEKRYYSNRFQGGFDGRGLDDGRRFLRPSAHERGRRQGERIRRTPIASLCQRDLRNGYPRYRRRS